MQERYGKPKALEKASQNPRWTIILASSGKPIFFYPSAEDKPMAGCDFSLAQPLLVPQIPLGRLREVPAKPIDGKSVFFGATSGTPLGSLHDPTTRAIIGTKRVLLEDQILG